MSRFIFRAIGVNGQELRLEENEQKSLSSFTFIERDGSTFRSFALDRLQTESLIKQVKDFDAARMRKAKRDVPVNA